MSDEFKKLSDAFRKADATPANVQAKKTAIAHALDAFDEKNTARHQGMGLGSRLKDTAIAVLETLIGRRPMKITPALLGGASLSVLVIAVLGANYVQTVQNGPLRQILNDNETVISPGKGEEDRVAGQRALLEPNKHPGNNPKTNSQINTTAKPQPEPETRERFENRPLEKKARELTATDQFGKDDRLSATAGALRTPANQQGLASGNKRERSLAQGKTFLPSAPPPRAEINRQRRDFAKRALIAKQKSTFADRPNAGIYRDQGRDKFQETAPNSIKAVSEAPVSTFSVDVDTASYAFMRASLNRNVLPQKNAVRVEELINYFPYDYEGPASKSAPFKAATSVYPSPWNKANKIIHIGIKGFDLKPAEKPRSNLVFLLDTSGSMNAPNKLPLLKNSMKLLLETLSPDDTVAIVTYAGSAGTALAPTKVKDKAKILSALNVLRPSGSTAGAEGIRQAYELAQQGFDKTGVNRVILATDGDFNVGITNREELKSFVERKRKTGIFLSVLGFGRGNYNDRLMQILAQNGNGNAAYIDSLNEARKVLVEEASSTLFTIAKDVKIQVEFNPAQVAEYRLIGYETRLLKREDFANDKIDAGDIGSGHTVTALYEITPRDSAGRLIGDLRYGKQASQSNRSQNNNGEYAFLKIRYKLPKEDQSKLITSAITPAREYTSLATAPREARFATSVAAFGQLLKGGRYTGSYGWDDVIALAQSAKGADEFGYRAEFINLARLAKSASALEPLNNQSRRPEHR